MTTKSAWWRDAVIYQVYLRSFADASGDGVGDLRGLVSRLDYLAELGIDAVWLNPCYLSPQADHGYDIADYYAIDPVYGDLADMDDLIAEAGHRGIRVLMDMVANHCSVEHEWFVEALQAAPGSPARERFHFLDGRGEGGALPPNNWQSVFGGSAWTRTTTSNGEPGEWYLHSFDSAQPDFNWGNADVNSYFDDVMRFWFDRGVAGFRVDVAHGMVKAEGLPDCVELEVDPSAHNYAMWDQPGVHDVYRRWRAIGESSGGEPRYFVGEIWVPDSTALRAYLADDEMHQAFAFDLLVQPWSAPHQREAIRRSLEVCGDARVPAWALSNHDVHRTVTRYGQDQDLVPPSPSNMIAAARRQGDVDIDLGSRRARAAAMIELALPGTPFLYQGEEIGLPEVLDLPDAARTDPIWIRSAGAELGRDGCRVPLPWSRDGDSFGFSDAPAAAWLPQPRWFSEFSVEVALEDPASMLYHYRALIAVRRLTFDVAKPLRWIYLDNPEVLAFARGDGICLVNFGAEPMTVPAEWDAALVAASLPAQAGEGDIVVPADGAVWLSSVASGSWSVASSPTTATY